MRQAVDFDKALEPQMRAFEEQHHGVCVGNRLGFQKLHYNALHKHAVRHGWGCESETVARSCNVSLHLLLACYRNKSPTQQVANAGYTTRSHARRSPTGSVQDACTDMAAGCRSQHSCSQASPLNPR